MSIHTRDNFLDSLKKAFGSEVKTSDSKVVVAAKKPVKEETPEVAPKATSKEKPLVVQKKEVLPIAESSKVNGLTDLPFVASIDPLKSEILNIITTQNVALVGASFYSTQIGQKMDALEAAIQKAIESYLSMEKKAGVQDILNKKQMGKEYGSDEDEDEEELTPEQIAATKAEKAAAEAAEAKEQAAKAKAELGADPSDPGFAEGYAEEILQEAQNLKQTIEYFYNSVYKDMKTNFTSSKNVTPKEFIDLAKSKQEYKDIENDYRSLIVSIFTFNGANRKAALNALKITSQKKTSEGENAYGDLQNILFGKELDNDDILNLSTHSTIPIKEKAIASSKLFSENFGKEILSPINGTIDLIVAQIKKYAIDKGADSAIAFRNGDFAIIQSIDLVHGDGMSEILRIQTGDKKRLKDPEVNSGSFALNRLNEMMPDGSPEIKISNANPLMNALESHMVWDFAERQPEFKTKDKQSVLDSLEVYGSLAEVFSSVVVTLKWFKPGAMGASLDLPNKVDSIGSIRLIKQAKNDYVAINIENHAPILVSGDDLFDMNIITTSNLQRYLSSGNPKILLEKIYKDVLKALIREEERTSNSNYENSKYKGSKFFEEIVSTMRKAAKYKDLIRRNANVGDLKIEKIVFPQNAEGSPVFGKVVNLKLNYKNRLLIFIDFIRRDPQSFQVASSEAEIKTGFKPVNEQDVVLLKAERDAIDGLTGKVASYNGNLSLILSKVPFAPVGADAAAIKKMLPENYVSFVETELENATSGIAKAPETKPVQTEAPIAEAPTPVVEKNVAPQKAALSMNEVEDLFREQQTLIEKIKTLSPQEKERLEKIDELLEDYDEVISQMVAKNGPKAEEELTKINKSISERRQKTLDPVHEKEMIAKVDKFTKDINLGKDSETGEVLSPEQLEKTKRLRDKLVDMLSDFGEGTLGVRPEGFNPEMDKQMALHNAMRGSEGDSLLTAINLLKMGGGEAEIKKFKANATKNLESYPDLTNFLVSIAKSKHPKAKQVAEFIRLIGTGA